MATVLAQQARQAGITINLKTVDPRHLGQPLADYNFARLAFTT